MTNFTRNIRPGTIDAGHALPRAMSIFCTIKFEDGKLSISGVEGPKSNGDCVGSCGQIVMSLREPGALDTFEPAPGWTLEGFREFLAIWDRWHLNEMRAYDAEMRAAGWPEKALTPIYKHEFSLSSETWAARRAAEAVAIEHLRAGSTFTPTAGQTQAAVLPLSLTIYSYDAENVEAPEFYEPSRNISGGGRKMPERKTLGWVTPSEHPDGLLTRKLREDGPGYGSSWFREDVPAEVLAFLEALPVADRANPWGDK